MSGDYASLTHAKQLFKSILHHFLNLEVLYVDLHFFCRLHRGTRKVNTFDVG